MGWRADLQDEVLDAEEARAGWHGSWEHQEVSLAVLRDQDGAQLDRAVSELDKESAHPAVLVVPIVNQTREYLLKVCPEWKTQLKFLWAAGSGLPLHHGCGDGGRRALDKEGVVSQVSEAELREFSGELGAGAEEPGARGTTLFLPTPNFMESAAMF